MIALGRYVTASCLDSLRWLAPGLMFVLSLFITYAVGGRALSTLAEGAAWLFPIAAWFTVTTLNNEDPSQAAITAAAAGGVMRAWAGKLLVATGVGLLMIPISLVAAFVTNFSTFTIDDLAVGAVAHVLTLVGGVALGSLFARPLVNRTALAVLAIIALALVDILIPYAPPVAVMAIALNHTAAVRQWIFLGIAAGEVAVVATALLVVSGYFTRARS